MGEQLKVLIVEDEMIIGANISLQLTQMGYQVTGIVPRGEDALHRLEKNMPDIVLLDINLKGNIDGIETAQRMQKKYSIPIIYLTANADDAHFKRAKTTNPYAFISKPFKKIDLQHAIELTANQVVQQKTLSIKKPKDKALVLEDRIFVKHHDTMVKLHIKDIKYIEADRNYCKIHAKDKTFLLVMTLKDILQKLPKEHFIRIHRSYIINLSSIDEIGSTHVVIAKKIIPFSKSYRLDLLKHLQTI